MTDSTDHKNGWVLKKEVSVGDVVAFVAALIAIIYAYSTLDSRVRILEVITTKGEKMQSSIDSRQDAESSRYQQRIDMQLKAINEKLDRLIEKSK